MNAFRIVLFDGGLFLGLNFRLDSTDFSVCSVCNSSVRFILRRDHARRVKFASLQSPIAASLLRERGLEDCTKELSTVVLLDTDGIVYFKSTAALRVLSQLAFPWSIIGRFLLLVPRFIRDLFYDFVARTRYRFWGSESEKSQCELRPEWRDRFLTLATSAIPSPAPIDSKSPVGNVKKE